MQTKNKTQEIALHTSTGNKPQRKIRAGPIVATVWRNSAKATGAEFITVSLERSYKDKDGAWQHTSSLRLGDLPKAALCLNKAYEYAVLDEQQPASTEDELLL